MNKIILSVLTFEVALTATVLGISNPNLNNTISNKSEGSLEASLEQYMKQYEMPFVIPMIGSTVTLDARNSDEEMFALKLKFNSGTEEQARKKSKIKKIFIPILILILLKAITLIPLGLGVLGIKTWNAIQLSFISFISAVVMAVWKLCTKVNHEPYPQIIHDSWDSHYHDRTDSQQRPYSSYAQNNKFVL